MQKIFTPRGIVKPLLIIGAVSCAVFLLDKGLGLLHTQASDKLMQCSATATDNTDKFGYSILAGIAASKATDTHKTNVHNKHTAYTVSARERVRVFLSVVD